MESKLVMPKVDYSKVSLLEKMRAKCIMVDSVEKCFDIMCLDCPLMSLDNYKEWLSQQPSKPRVFKWPISSKERFFVLPRVFVNTMPNKWQKRFLSLLNEYNKKHVDNKFWEPIKFRVSATKYGQFVKMPDIFKRG